MSKWIEHLIINTNNLWLTFNQQHIFLNIIIIMYKISLYKISNALALYKIFNFSIYKFYSLYLNALKCFQYM